MALGEVGGSGTPLHKFKGAMCRYLLLRAQQNFVVLFLELEITESF